MPVTVFCAAPKQGDGVMLVEQRTESPGDLGGGAQQSRVVPSKFRSDPA